MHLLALIPALLTAPALAQDDTEESSFDLDALMDEMDIGESTSNKKGDSEQNVSYSGTVREVEPTYTGGGKFTVSHSGGNIAVHCTEAKGITATIQYTVEGTNKANMERFGKAVRLSVGASGTTGWVKSVTPSKGSGVSTTDLPLVVNIPRNTYLTITGGNGWVQVTDCDGTVTSTNKLGGAYVSGKLSQVNVTASAGDVKIDLTDDSVLSGASKVTATTGKVVMKLPLSYNGKFYGKAAEVKIHHAVNGSNDEGLVSGTIGTPGSTSLTITAKDAIEVAP